MSEYKLNSILTQGRVVQMAVIGCGGTGSAFASGLPYLPRLSAPKAWRPSR